MATTYVLFLNHDKDELAVCTYAAYKKFEDDHIELLLESEDVNYLCELAGTTKVICLSVPPEIAEQFD